MVWMLGTWTRQNAGSMLISQTSWAMAVPVAGTFSMLRDATRRTLLYTEFCSTGQGQYLSAPLSRPYICDVCSCTRGVSPWRPAAAAGRGLWQWKRTMQRPPSPAHRVMPSRWDFVSETVPRRHL